MWMMEILTGEFMNWSDIGVGWYVVLGCWALSLSAWLMSMGPTCLCYFESFDDVSSDVDMSDESCGEHACSSSE